MRTGSNFLEANINQLPGVHSYGEAFNPYLIGGEGRADLFGFSLAARDADPASFLRSMRAHTKGLAGFRVVLERVLAAWSYLLPAHRWSELRRSREISRPRT